jgi:hypothetical protein
MAATIITAAAAPGRSRWWAGLRPVRSSPRRRTTGTDRYYARPVAYAPPPPAYYAPQQPCRVVNRLDDVEGYTVKMAATMCYDSSGRAYIVQGSQHPVDDSYDY